MRCRFDVRSRFFMLLLVFPLLNSPAAAQGDRPAPKYILFLTADGFRSDYVEWYHPPHIEQLIAEGTRVLNATNVFPTLTTPNMTSLVTGSYPRTTGIAANTQYVKELDKLVPRPRDNKAETIAETLQKAGWTTGAVNHFMLENRGAEVYVPAGYEESEATTAAVLDLLTNRKARFVGAIYGATDKAGHRHGPRSEEVKAAVLEIDAAIGRLIAGIKELGIYEETLIAFNSDHGMSPWPDRQASVEPAMALRQAGFRVATAEWDLKPDTEIVILSFGVRLVYFRDATLERRERAMEVLSTIEGAEVLDREDLEALGCHDNRSGDVMVSPLPGFVISGAGRPGGFHGQLSERDPVLFFRGPGIKRGATLAGARNIDVVPTVLALAGVEPATTVEGQVILEALERRPAVEIDNR